LSRVRRKIGPLGTSTIRFTALPTDCDLNFHINAGRYISFMDVARVELLGRMRLFRPVIKKGWRPINGGMIIRFRRSVLPLQRFAVRSRVLGWDEKWIYFEHVIERNGDVYVIGNARGVLRGPNGNVRPEDFLALAGMSGTTSPALPEYVQRWRELETAR
ncbi:MAG TPA: thioesterase family protein, partial [Thermoanaerobaculia bacterium]|nr:thioesterase family protein [Thermoanaerobaculia bacterium]